MSSIGRNASNTRSHSGAGMQPREPVFNAFLAHGGLQGKKVQGFKSVKELYAKIGEAFNIHPDQILYCTLNTSKIDMDKLIGGKLETRDSIYAHIKGQKYEITMDRNERALGLVITDNGAGYAFVKRIGEGSAMSQNEHIAAGDHVVMINGQNMVGCTHFQVVKALTELPFGKKFRMELWKPMNAVNVKTPINSTASPVGYNNIEAPIVHNRGNTTTALPSGYEQTAAPKVDLLRNSMSTGGLGLGVNAVRGSSMPPVGYDFIDAPMSHSGGKALPNAYEQTPLPKVPVLDLLGNFMGTGDQGLGANAGRDSLASPVSYNTINAPISHGGGNEIQPRPNEYEQTAVPKVDDMGNYKETGGLNIGEKKQLDSISYDDEQAAVQKVKDLLESYMGLKDHDLATSIVDMLKGKTDLEEFMTAFEGDFGIFGFPEDFVFDVWGFINDAKEHRLKTAGKEGNLDMDELNELF